MRISNEARIALLSLVICWAAHAPSMASAAEAAAASAVPAASDVPSLPDDLFERDTPTPPADYCTSEANRRRVLALVKEVYAVQLGVPLRDVKTHSDVVLDLGADSDDDWELAAAVEDEFDVDIPDADVGALLTPASAAQYVLFKKCGRSVARKPVVSQRADKRFRCATDSSGGYCLFDSKPDRK